MIAIIKKYFIKFQKICHKSIVCLLYNIKRKCFTIAYLAKEVNSGTDYQGKHFTLNRDWDLNNIEWTPIGNGTNSFHGILR